VIHRAFEETTLIDGADRVAEQYRDTARRKTAAAARSLDS
jgi:hypothetical protein